MSSLILRTVAVLAGLAPLVFVVLPGPVRAQAKSNSVTWNSYLGGTAADGTASATDDRAEGVITDRSGGIYVGGSTNAPQFPGNLTPPLTTRDQDAFVTRFHSDGGVAWSRLFGGTAKDEAKRVALVPSIENRLYVVGTTSSSSLRDSVPVHGSFDGGTDAFLAQVELDGGVSWFMYLGEDEGNDLAVDVDKGVVYVVGRRATDAFVTQVDISKSPPSVVWSTPIGTAGPDNAYAVVLSQFGLVGLSQVYVGGVVSNQPLVSPPTSRNGFAGGDNDGFVAEMEPGDGGVKWFAYLGGRDPDDVRDILYQPRVGGITVIGNTESPEFPPKAPSATRRGIFVVRIDLDHMDAGYDAGIIKEDEQTRIGGSGNEIMEGHASSDVNGNVYFGGRTTSESGLALDAFDTALELGSYGNDGFVAMVDPDLTGLIWASYVGGPTGSSEAVMGMSAVPLGQLTFVGRSTATTGLLVVDAGYDLSANGGEDLFVFRLAVNPDAGPATRPDASTPDASTPDASTPDASTPDASTPDAGSSGNTDAGTDPEQMLSPVGFSCGSSGGGSMAGAVALMALALLTRTRRPER